MHDYAGVLVPLHEAHLHSHSARTGRTEFEPRHDDAEDDAHGKDEDSESQGMLMMDAAEYTIEGLRKETREGRRGQWTEYESELAGTVLSAKPLLTWRQSNPSSSTRPSRTLAWGGTTGSCSSSAVLDGSQISEYFNTYLWSNAFC